MDISAKVRPQLTVEQLLMLKDAMNKALNLGMFQSDKYTHLVAMQTAGYLELFIGKQQLNQNLGRGTALYKHNLAASAANVGTHAEYAAKQQDRPVAYMDQTPVTNAPAVTQYQSPIVKDIPFDSRTYEQHLEFATNLDREANSRYMKSIEHLSLAYFSGGKVISKELPTSVDGYNANPPPRDAEIFGSLSSMSDSVDEEDI